MVREVRAADGRSWTVRREIVWRKPELDHEFEHDVAVGQVAGIMLLGLIILMVLTLVIWKPDGVYGTSGLLVAVLVVALLATAQWAGARPWIITADTYEPLATSGERWVGTVRGLRTSRREVSRVVTHLERHAIPNDGHGPLQPLSTTMELPTSEFGG